MSKTSNIWSQLCNELDKRNSFILGLFISEKTGWANAHPAHPIAPPLFMVQPGIKDFVSERYDKKKDEWMFDVLLGATKSSGK